jgi:hypothetical protein
MVPIYNKRVTDSSDISNKPTAKRKFKALTVYYKIRQSNLFIPLLYLEQITK